MDSLDTCVKLEMTKTGAVPGQMGLATSSEHTSSNTTHYLLLIGAPSYFWECCFTVLRSLRRCLLTSPDQANGSFTTLGIASCALSYLYPDIRDHYEFVLCYTYGVPSDNHQFTVGLTVLYRLWHYKNVLRGIMVTP